MKKISIVLFVLFAFGCSKEALNRCEQEKANLSEQIDSLANGVEIL